MHQPPPVRRHVRVVLVVAQHLAPARREIHRVVFDVEIPQAVVGRGQRERRALLDLGQVALHPQALEPGGEAGADQLQHQVQVGVPAITARLRRHQRHEAADTVVQRQPAHQRRAHVEAGQALGIDGVIPARLERVADLRQAQVFELAGQQRQALDGVTLEHLRIERRQQAGGARHALDVLAVRVEQRDADCVDAGRLAQRFEVALDAVVARFAGERDEIDGDLGDEDIETDGGTTATAEDELGGQEVVRFLFFATGDRRGLRRHRAIRSPWARPGQAREKLRKDPATREPDSDIKGAKLKLRR